MTVELKTDVVPLLPVLSFVTDVPVPAPVMVVPAGRFGHCADDITTSSETFSTVVSHPPAIAVDGDRSATTAVATRAIGDVALGLSDTVLHLVYNALAYAGLAYAYLVVLRSQLG
jgi:hypothetical protein